MESRAPLGGLRPLGLCLPGARGLRERAESPRLLPQHLGMGSFCAEVLCGALGVGHWAWGIGRGALGVGVWAWEFGRGSLGVVVWT
jgi:hypothetical protein